MVSLSRQLALASVTGFALLCLCSPVWAADGAIRAIRFDPSSQHFVIDATGPVRAIVNTLTIAGHKRVIVDVENAEIGMELPRDSQLLQDLMRQMPSLRNVTVNQYSGNGRPIVRILFDIDSDRKTVRLVQNQGSRLELEVTDPTLARPLPVPPVASQPATAQSAQPDEPPSGAAQPVYTAPTAAKPAPPADTVPKSVYNETLQALEEQQQQIDALQKQVSQLKTSSPVATPPAKAETDPAVQALKTTLANLNHQYEALEQENRVLKAKVAESTASGKATSQLQAELESLHAKNSQLQTQLASQSRPDPRLAERQAEVERLQQINRDLQQRLQDALATASKGPSEEEMKRTLVRMNQQYEQLSQENRNLRTELSQVRSQSPGVSSQELHALRDQLTTAQQSLADSVRTINSQNQEIAYLRNQVADVKAGMDASAREQIARLQTAQDEKNARIRELETQLATKSNTSGKSSSQAELATLKRQLDQLSERYQTDVAALNRQLQAKNEHLQASETQVDSLQTQARQGEALQRQVVSLQAKLTEAERKLAEAQSQAVSQTELQQRDSRIAALQSENARLKALQAQYDTAQSEIASLKSALAKNKQAGKQNVKVDQELVAVKDELAKTVRENQALQAQLTELKNRPKPGSDEQVQALERKLATLQTELSDTKAKAAQAEAETQKARQELAAARQKPTGAKAGASSGKAEIAGLEKKISELNRQLAETRQENNTIKERLTSMASQSSGGGSSGNAEAEEKYAKGKAALIAGELEKAIDLLKTAQLLDPDSSKITVDYGIALAENRQYADAADLLRRYLQRNPVDRDAYNQLGKIYLLNDQADAATQAFSRAIPVSTLNNYATTLKKLNRMDEAENVFKLALSLDPRDSEVLFNLGNLYNATNQLEQARNQYLQAIQYKPDFAEAHYNLGLVFSKLGDKQQAVNHLEKFLQLSPGARNAETIRAYVQKLKA